MRMRAREERNMLGKQIKSATELRSLLLVLLAIVCIYALAKQREMQQGANASAPVSYKVLEDYMGTEIIIGVESDVDEEQLLATLVKAADEHQRDPARDLLLSDYLWIKAYLIDGENRSKVPAGRLRRYVPPRNPREGRDHWLDWLPYIVGKRDKFYLTLEEARRTL